MNCKPGDLAVIVASDFQENIGAIVEVIEPGDFYDGDTSPQWSVCSQGRDLKFQWWYVGGHSTGCLGYSIEVDVSDDELRPIRDHGDEAKDEMLRPLPLEHTPA